MRAPVSWLREYVTIDLPIDELASRLALTGTEVERVNHVGVPSEEAVLECFVVGKVLTCEKHPDADKLSVCTVDVDEETPRTIVCGAPNVAAGQTVAVSLPGAVLPNGMKIKDAKLRGVPSSGMILSDAELGFDTKSSGIMVLPDDWEAGDLLADHLPLHEAILEVEVTPNRPDCLSIWGMAREIAAITGADFDEDISVEVPHDARQVDEDITVEVWDPDLCPRYAARVIRGVTVAPSPSWLKARITHAGMRPVNNVVDVTNFVMWAVGQPLHAFDLATVAGRRIIARRAVAGETITTLDGVDRVLAPDMLVIADAEKPSVIAGIMGSLNSEITDVTTEILLEAANFHGASIMRTSGALGLRSESSTRFEKGLDPNLVPVALDLACRLLIDVCGGVVSAGTADVAAAEWLPWEVCLRPGRVEAILGDVVPDSEIESILGSLGCDVRESYGDFTVVVPTYRRDLEREIDLIEEVARIHGLDKLPSTIPGRVEGRGGLSPDQRRLRGVADTLRGAALNEVITWSFGDPSWHDRLRLATDDVRRRTVVISNPLSQDQSVMRTMLLPGLLTTAQRNAAVREQRIHLFEIGTTFHPESEATSNALPHEVKRVGILMSGAWEEDSWNAGRVPTDFFLVKGVVERLLYSLGVDGLFYRAAEPFLHPGKSATIGVGDQQIGWLGEVHPLVLQAFDLPTGAVAAELDAGALLSMGAGVPLFEDLLTFPAVEHDLALVVDRDVAADDVVRAVRAAGGSLLRSVSVFDVFEGAQVGEGKKSLALRLSFRSPERTLAEAEVNEARAGMLDALRASMGAELRA